MATIECICPARPDGTPRHAHGDTVTLRERLDLRGALTARNAFLVAKAEDPDMGAGEILAVLTETYLLVGIESWTLADARNKAVPVTRAAVREFIAAHPEAAMVVGDEADSLYSEAVITPLVQMASTSSPPTSTTASTSPTTGSSETVPKRSKRSSTSTSRTGGIVSISRTHDGDSSSSLSTA